jgi:small ligand-binding sensory domain FIST
MPLIGGLASGAQQPGENSLFFNEQVFKEGAVGVILTGDVELKTIVSQGCRPIGRPYIVTQAQENVILELAGMPPAHVLQQLFAGLSPGDRALAQRALLLGIVMDEKRQEFRRGDFLIRNLIGLDPETGAMAIGDQIRVGQTVQFQLRDAHTSREDLELLLKERADGAKRSGCAGGLLFCCLGRGQDLYGEPNVDIRTIQSALGNLPIAGFFCSGEIGPIAGRNFIHGFTSSLGLFRPRLTG